MAEQTIVRRSPRAARGPGLVAALAAFAVATIFVSVLPDVMASTGFRDLSPHLPWRLDLLSPAAVALAVVAPLPLRRVTGWLVALVGLLVVMVTDQTVGDSLVVPRPGAVYRDPAAFLVEATGVGLALGGVLLAIGQAARSVRVPAAVGLAAGLVGQPLCVLVARSLLPPFVPPVEAQLWLALAATLAAVALRGLRWMPDAPRPAVDSPRWSPVVAVTVAALVVVGGNALRWWVATELRGNAGGLPRDAVDTLFRHSAPALAVVAALILLGYAQPALGLAGVRWVTVGLAAGTVTLGSWLFRFNPPSRQLFVVAVVGLLAVAAGATLARYAEWAFPWDALGVVVAAAASLLATQRIGVTTPSVFTIGAAAVALGLGLTLAFGITRVAIGPAIEDRTWPATALAVGMAAWVLTAQALAPVMAREQVRYARWESSVTLPVLTGAAGVLLVVLFVVGRQVRRLPDELSHRPG